MREIDGLQILWLDHLDLNNGPIAKYFEHLAHEGTPKATAIFIKADEVADASRLTRERHV